MTENDVTAIKYQNFHGDENFTRRGKGSTSEEDDVTYSIGAPVRKGRTTSCLDRRKKIECTMHCSGRRRAATKPSHCATHGRYGRKEHPGSKAVPENHGNV
jgi:hypothetical protein